jgi:hypothetical protein
MIGILGFVFVIIAPYFVYRSAKQNGHNAVLWTLLALAAGIGLQIILPLLIGTIITVFALIKGLTAEEIQQSIQGPANVIALVCLFLSIVGVFLIMRRVNTVRDSPESYAPTPPAPPKFD